MSDTPELDDGPPRRVNIDLFIVHPTMAPAEISDALGLEAHFAHLVGDVRKTPKGTLLSGKYKDTRWRHRIRYELRGQWFAAEVTTFVNRLLAHKTFFHHVRATGGSAQIIVNFLGDGYLGDTVPVESLAKMAELQLDLGLECFTVPQR